MTGGKVRLAVDFGRRVSAKWVGNLDGVGKLKGTGAAGGSDVALTGPLWAPTVLLAAVAEEPAPLWPLVEDAWPNDDLLCCTGVVLSGISAIDVGRQSSYTAMSLVKRGELLAGAEWIWDASPTDTEESLPWQARRAYRNPVHSAPLHVRLCQLTSFHRLTIKGGCGRCGGERIRQLLRCWNESRSYAVISLGRTRCPQHPPGTARNAPSQLQRARL